MGFRGLGEKLKDCASALKEADLSPSGIFSGIKTLFRDTPSEIVLCAILGTVASGYYMHGYETQRANTKPLGFSEIGQILKDAKRQGKTVGPFTNYQTSVNDAYMKTAECWNIAHEGSKMDPIKTFAQELEFKIDPAFKNIYHYNLKNFLAEKLPVESKDVLEQLSVYIALMQKLGPVGNSFENAWKDYHNDEFRTEFYTEEVCSTDSNNNRSCHSEMRTRQVYDHTDHSYYYYAQHGEAASSGLDRIVAEYPTLPQTERLQTTSKTNADGEYAAEVSRYFENGRRMLTNEESLEIANRWATGATITVNMPTIHGLNGALKGDSDAWRTAKTASKNHFYPTNSHFDSGPKEFQTNERAKDHVYKLQENIGEIIAGIKYTQANAPVLYGKIQQLIDIELNGKEGDGKKVAKEIMEMNDTMYKMNFKNGFDTHDYRWYLTMGAMLAGVVLGGAVGAGIDKLADKYSIWGVSTDWRGRGRNYYNN